VRILEAGMIVQIAGDVRWTGPRTANAHFLGNRYQFTTTWITLAAMSGAPVVPVYSVMNPDGSCSLEFLDAFNVSPNALKTDEARQLVQRNLDQIEAHVRQHPDNSLDYLFWTENDQASPEAEAA